MEVIVLVLCFISVCFGAQIRADCGSTDIVFLIDSSGSVGSSNFQREKDFVTQMSQTFRLDANHAQVGVVTFSTTPRLEFKLSDYHTHNALQTAIQKIPYHSGNTHTDLALNYAVDHMFTASGGSRANAKKILIVLTDGQSNNKALTTAAANKVHAHNIKTYVVGIGNGVNMDELHHIASDSYHLFSVANFQQLQTIPSKIEQEACGSTFGSTLYPVTTAPTFAPSHCGAADVMFLLDSSGSVGVSNFHKELQFVASFAANLPIGSSDTQIGVTTFSSVTHPQFNLNKYHDSRSLIQAILRLPYQSGGTHTADGINYVAHHNFIPAAGDRPDAPNILIVVTDGRSSNTLATANAAHTIHNLGIKTFAIGVGNNVGANELSAIATDSKHLFEIANFDSLSTLQSELHFTTCGVSTFRPTHSHTTAQHVSSTTTHQAPSTTPWIVHPVISENCHDEVPTCLNYGPDICVKYQSWAKLRCAKFCAFCEVAPTTYPTSVSSTAYPTSVKTKPYPSTVTATPYPTTVKTTPYSSTVTTTTTYPTTVKPVTSTPYHTTVQTTPYLPTVSTPPPTAVP